MKNVHALAEAIFVANRHAKTALDNRYLYSLKRTALEKLVREGVAKKVGLHYSPSDRWGSRSDVLVKVGEFYFHLPATSKDLKDLKHLGHRDNRFRNPRPKMSRTEAYLLLEAFTGLKKKDFLLKKGVRKKVPKGQIFKSTYLDGSYKQRIKRASAK